MKKIIAIFTLFSILFMTRININATQEESDPHIDDNTTIQEDLTLMGLNYQDYLITGTNYDRLLDFYNSEGYSEQFVIAVGENYTQTPGKIISFIYCYNPLMYYGDINIILYISLNDNYYKTLHYNAAYTDMQIAKEDKEAGMVCFKLELFKSTDLARKYSIDINHSGMSIFECTYVTETNGNKKCNYFNYDSCLYITKDKVVSCTFKDCKDLGFGPFKDLTTFLAGKDPNLNTVVYFYNFSSSKKIEKIISADMQWVENQHKSGYAAIPGSTAYRRITTQNNKKQRKETIGIKDKTSLKLWDNEFTVDPFSVPASDRLKELPSDYVSKMTSQQKELFTGYEYSILFASGIYKDIIYPVINSSEQPYYKEMLLVEDVRLTKLVYETDGVLYNSIIVDNDGSDQGFTSDEKPDIESPKPEYNGFQKLLLWLGESTIHFFSPTAKWPDWGYIIIGGIDFVLMCLVALAILYLLFRKVLVKLFLLPFRIIKKI